jgi:hypothetical protein
MLAMEWKALREGDRVLVHHPTDGIDDVVSGTVVMVDMLRASNAVGIRITPSGVDPLVIWPSSRIVHLDPRGREPCWRCVAAENPEPLKRSA